MDGSKDIFNSYLSDARTPLVAAMKVFYEAPEHLRKEMQQDYENFIKELITLEDEVRD